MDPAELRPSPRRELQGPRPAPLRVNKDSHKIKKPPVPPPHHPPRPTLPPPPQQPVIIYTVSPKIIHAKPSEFMTLVQRLTGPNSSSADPSLLQSPVADLSPAARIASFERPPAPSPRAAGRAAMHGEGGGGLMDQWAQTGHRPASILSPVPAMLPPISPNLFSPSMFDPSVLSLLHELSPALANPTFAAISSARSPMDGGQGGGFSTSPLPFNYNLLLTPTVPSPGAFWDLLSQFPDT